MKSTVSDIIVSNANFDGHGQLHLKAAASERLTNLHLTIDIWFKGIEAMMRRSMLGLFIIGVLLILVAYFFTAYTPHLFSNFKQSNTSNAPKGGEKEKFLDLSVTSMARDSNSNQIFNDPATLHIKEICVDGKCVDEEKLSSAFIALLAGFQNLNNRLKKISEIAERNMERNNEIISEVTALSENRAEQIRELKQRIRAMQDRRASAFDRLDDSLDEMRNRSDDKISRLKNRL